MKRFMVMVLVLPLLALVSCATQTPKQSAEEGSKQVPPSGEALQAQVDALLSGYERVPTDEEWKRLGPEALPALEKIYRDASALPSKRSRAVSGMAQVDNPRANEVLKEIVLDPKSEQHLRATAMLALGYRGGPEAIAALEPMLAHDEPALREGAARALAKVGTPQAKQPLEERLDRETDPVVREAIQQSLTKLTP